MSDFDRAYPTPALDLATPWAHAAVDALAKTRAAMRRVVAGYRQVHRERETLGIALRRFGRHLPFCLGADRRCTCGFAGALELSGR